MRAKTISTTMQVMRALLLMAAVVMTGCDDEVGPPEGTPFGYYVALYADAMQDRAIRCGTLEAEHVGARVTQNLCAWQPCDEPLGYEIDIDSCVAAVLDLPCSERMQPLVCVDMLAPL